MHPPSDDTTVVVLPLLVVVMLLEAAPAPEMAADLRSAAGHAFDPAVVEAALHALS